MVLLILESLGSEELLFILVMALVFLGPRKLPQISRSLGKHLAQFRQASEDFKRTWDREVTLEEVGAQTSVTPPMPHTENSILDDKNFSQPFQPPTIEAVPADRVIPRQAIESIESAALYSSDEPDLSSGPEFNAAVDLSEPSRKRDWL